MSYNIHNNQMKRMIRSMLTASYLLGLGIKSILAYTRKSRQDEELEKRTGEDTMKAQNDLMNGILAPLTIPYDLRPELGSGDKIATRPIFQGVIDDLRKGIFQAIAVKEISRMGRGSYTDMGVIYDLLVEKRIFVITPWKVYDPKNPADLRQIRFELFLSREEFETTRERLLGGRITNAMSGKWVSGKAPYGYKYNDQTRKLEIIEEEAAVIRTIFDYYVNGVPMEDGSRRDVSFRALGTYLQRKTLLATPKGKRNWQPMYLKTLLTSERFMGTLRFRSTQKDPNRNMQILRPEEEHIVVENAIPAIIDRETWDKAQAKVNTSENKPRTKLDFSPCELASLAVCRKCGAKMVRQYSIQRYKKEDGEVSEYHKEFLWCRTPGCTFVKYREVEEDLLEVLRYFRDLDPALLKEQVAGILEEQKKSTGAMSPEEMIRLFDQREKELQQKRKFIYKQYEDEVYSVDEFKERRGAVDAELSELNKMRESLQDGGFQESEQAIDPEQIKTNMTSILEAYQKCTNKTDKNTILRQVFDHVIIEITERGRGRRSAKFILYPVLKRNLLSDIRLV